MMHAIAQITLLADILSSCNVVRHFGMLLVNTFLFERVGELCNMDHHCIQLLF